MQKLKVKKYEENKAALWDKFVLKDSMNGMFLQTRKFINYHAAGKFRDCSLMFYKGESLAAVVLACEIESDGKKVFFHIREQHLEESLFQNTSILLLELWDLWMCLKRKCAGKNIQSAA